MALQLILDFRFVVLVESLLNVVTDGAEHGHLLVIRPRSLRRIGIADMYALADLR